MQTTTIMATGVPLPDELVGLASSAAPMLTPTIKLKIIAVAMHNCIAADDARLA